MSQYGTAVYGQGAYSHLADHPYIGITGKVMWLVQVDWDQDGVFGGDIELQSIRKLSIKRGRRKRMRADGAGQMQPGAESILIELIDPAGRYDVFNTSSPIYAQMGAPGLLLRVLMVSSTSKATAQAVFVGTLTSIQYDVKSGVATLSGDGLSKYLQLGVAANLYSPIQKVPGYDTCFVWNGSTPTPFNYWKGRVGGLDLQACAGIVLGLSAWPMGVNYGTATASEQPDYFFLSGESGWEALKDLGDGFMARLFFQRTGALYVMDRLDLVGAAADLPAPVSPQEAFGLVRESPYYTLKNHVEVKVRPHSVPLFVNPYLNGNYKTIWYNDGPVMLAAGETLTIDVKYPDSLGSPSQASFARTNTDLLLDSPYFTAWSMPNKTGTRLDNYGGTGDVEIGMVEPVLGSPPVGSGYNQKYCQIGFVNWGAVPAYLFDIGVKAAGVIEAGASLTKILDDLPSQVLNGKREIIVNSRWIQSMAQAGIVGQAYLDALSLRELASVAAVTYQWSGQDLYNNLVNYDLGVHVDYGVQGGADALENFGLWGRRLIVGQELNWLSPDGQDAFVKLILEKEIMSKVTAGAVSGAAALANLTLTWSHTVPAGNNRLLVVSLARSGGSVVASSVKFGSQNLVCLGTKNAPGGAGNPGVELWYLAAPAVSTANIVVTMSGAQYIECGAQNFTNVNQISPMSTAVGASGPAGTALVVVPSNEYEIVIDVLGFWSPAITATVGAGQTQRWASTSEGAWKGAGSTEIGSASVNMSWSIAATWALLAAAIRGAG